MSRKAWNDGTHKQCNKCGEKKLHAEFQKRSAIPDGLANMCKSCMKVYVHPRIKRWQQTSSAGRANVARNNRRRNEQRKRKLELLRESQGYRCAVCKRHEDEVGLLRSDHCHSTGLGREMICNGCNLGLGHFQDDVEIMQSAISYVKKRRRKHQRTAAV